MLYYPAFHVKVSAIEKIYLLKISPIEYFTDILFINNCKKNSMGVLCNNIFSHLHRFKLKEYRHCLKEFTEIPESYTYVDNICTLTANMKFICTSFRNR
jgi:heme oxygenase